MARRRKRTIRASLAELDRLGQRLVVRLQLRLAGRAWPRGRATARQAERALEIFRHRVQLAQQLPLQRRPVRQGYFEVHLPAVHAGGQLRRRRRRAGDAAAEPARAPPRLPGRAGALGGGGLRRVAGRRRIHRVGAACGRPDRAGGYRGGAGRSVPDWPRRLQARKSGWRWRQARARASHAMELRRCERRSPSPRRRSGGGPGRGCPSYISSRNRTPYFWRAASQACRMMLWTFSGSRTLFSTSTGSEASALRKVTSPMPRMRSLTPWW